jgi:RNA polymerase sigma-70 factor (ECF subfamily)
MSQSPDVRRLVGELQKGNREAFKTIYEGYGSRIYNFLYRLLGSKQEAEDATQQTFLMAFQRIGTLRNPDVLEPWIYRIARNEVYQKFRRKPVDSLDDHAPGIFADRLKDERLQGLPEQALLNKELREVLQAVLEGLPLKLREVFILAVVEEMSYQDISEIVGRSLLSVKTDIYRARIMAKQKISRYLTSGDKNMKRKGEA